jgi:hypothetical protein
MVEAQTPWVGELTMVEAQTPWVGVLILLYRCVPTHGAYVGECFTCLFYVGEILDGKGFIPRV